MFLDSARLVFAKNLRRFRQAQGLSQEALASKAKLHRTYIGAVERGEVNISIDNMEKLAATLDVPLAQLLSEGVE